MFQVVYDVARGATARRFGLMKKLSEIQSAILELDPAEREELRHWLDETAEETPEMLAAIDEGLRSLKEKDVVAVEDFRLKIPQWATKSV